MKAGDVLAGRYRLLFPIGEGGMGAVWRARQVELDADVAIKVLHAKTAQAPGAISRFKREAKASAALRSPHVVQVVDYGVDEATGTPFIAMELLEGESLAARLVRKGRLDPDESARWIMHAARALTRAHAAGVVHRDLKPANIFIVQNEDEELAKVVDFGIAKLVGQEHGETATATGALLGTPHYMSPEQIDPSRAVDFRADLWSLAVIACECVTGRRPFEGDTLASLAMKISLSRSELPSSLGPVPRGFDAWFAKGTEVDPERRFGSALELAAALREVVDAGEMMVSAPSRAALPATTRQELTPSVLGLSSGAAASAGDAPAARRGVRRGVAVAAGVALVGGAGVLWGAWRGSGPTPGLSGASSGAPSVMASVQANSVAHGADAGAPGAADPAPAVNRAPEHAPPAPPRVNVIDGEAPASATIRGTAGGAARDLAAPRARTRPRKSAAAARPSAAKASPRAPQHERVDPYDLL